LSLNKNKIFNVFAELLKIGAGIFGKKGKMILVELAEQLPLVVTV
jgi:hypothetical protein